MSLIAYTAWGHLLFFTITVFTCYYSRYFLGKRVQMNPRECSLPENPDCCYFGENPLHRLHRYFYWLAVLFMGSHISVALPTLIYYDSMFIVGTLSLGLAFFLWAISCHYFRYFFEERVVGSLPRGTLLKKIGFKILNIIRKLNTYHKYFVWLTLLSFIMHFFLAGNL